MTFDTSTDYDADDELDRMAQTQGVERDRLGQYEHAYEGFDPFRAWWHKEIVPRNLAESTTAQYRRHIEDWMDYMESVDRHPALPSEAHIKGYVDWSRQQDHGRKYIKAKFKTIARAFDFFAGEEACTAHVEDSNIVRYVGRQLHLEPDPDPDFPPLDLAAVREFVTDCNHIRDRLIISSQLKWGIRAGTVANIKIEDIDLGGLLSETYPELGTSHGFDGGDYTNAIYFPADRKGTKNAEDVILPVDYEMREMLARYLLIRPDNGESALFLSSSKQEPMSYSAIGDVWEKHVTPRFDTDRYRPVTSHFGRHFFSDFWAVEKDMNRHLVQYMRGDTIAGPGRNREGIDEYLNPEYADIEQVYRDEMYRLLV